MASGIAAMLSIYPVAQPAAAAEINDQGARSLKDSITRFLPDPAKSSDFLSVKPAGERYEISYDFAKLLDTIKDNNFTVSGLMPLSLFAAPLDNGQWKLNSQTHMNVSVEGNADGKPSSLTYSVTGGVFSGIFDPAISYLRSATATSGPIRMVSKSGPEEVEASFAGMDYSLASTDGAAPGSVDFSGKGSLSRFYEQVSTPEMPPVRIRASSLDFDVGAQGVVAAKIRDLVFFGIDLVKDEKPSEAEIAQLKVLLRGAMPFFTSLSEKLSMNGITVESLMGDFGLGKLDYTFTMSEPSTATRIGIGTRIEKLSMPAGIVPDVYAQLVPDLAELNIGIADLNFSRFMDTLMEIDLSKPGPPLDEEGTRLGQAFLDNGQMTVDFPKILAKSPLYDIEASGKVKGYPEQTDRYSLETSIFARDIDKLIQYFQRAGKSDPQLNQASFVLMMAKGMAKTEPDGRLRWDIKFKDGKDLSVNGQSL